MRALSCFIALFLSLSISAHAQQKKPDKPAAPKGDDRFMDVRVPDWMRGRLTAAAVWVSSADDDGQMGVLIQKAGDVGLVLTHASAIRRTGNVMPAVHCTFNVNLKAPRKFKAEVVETEGPLVLLKVEARDLPVPIHCDDDLAWKSGQPLYAVCFDGPFEVNRGFQGKVEFA